MNTFDYLFEGKIDSATALLTLKGEHSYGQLRSGAVSVSDFLARAGARSGQRVILIADPGPFWVSCYLGILRSGLVCVPLPPRLPAEELRYICEVTEPSFVFLDAKYKSQVSPLLHSVPMAGEEIISCAGSQQSVSSRPQDSGCAFSDVGPHDLAAIMFTSGSTGKPRGVMVSHRNIIANTDSIVQYLHLTPDDRIMSVLPFHYCFGASLLHTHLRVGGSVVIDSRFMYPEAVLHRMQQTSCTGFAGVPSHFQILLRKSALASMSFPRLRYVQQAGGHLAPAFVSELRRALPHTKIFVMYGQTEATARLSCLPPAALDAKLGSVGKGIPGVKLSVLNESGERVRPGETGEIVAEGANIALGYWRDPEETARHFRNGKLYTGDLATVDHDGFIFIVDRAKDFLKCGGTRISCRHLENILLEHESLLEAAMIGVPDDVLGEAAIAFVVARDPKSPPSSDLLAKYCWERMPYTAVPRRFIFLRALPKNSSGKVLKPLLKAPEVVATLLAPSLPA